MSPMRPPDNRWAIKRQPGETPRHHRFERIQWAIPITPATLSVARQQPLQSPRFGGIG